MKIREAIIEAALTLSSWLTILTTLGILCVLLFQTLEFFSQVSIISFFTDTQWTPLFSQKHFGIWPLLLGTLLTSFIAIFVAFPIGLCIAIYLSEYAGVRLRNYIKPVLEVLAAIPTVVYGYFALLLVTPFLQSFIPGLSAFNALAPGIVMGIMIIPLIASLSEDALHSVPRALREGAYALGATRLQAIFGVLIPAAFSGIAASCILAISRAIGETMIVAIAAGQQPQFTLNPLVPIETATTYIVQVSLGDTPHGSLEYQTIFAVGMTLFVFTFLLNNISFYLKKRFREIYE